MKTKAHFQATGYHAVTPYLIASDASGAIDFYKQAFGATELMRIGALGGKVGHAEIQIGDSRIMLADEAPQCNAFSPRTVGGTPVSLMLYVPDVDAMFNKAVSLGAKVLQPVDASSTATAAARLPIRLAISGRSQHMWKTFRPTKWQSGLRLCLTARSRTPSFTPLICECPDGETPSKPAS